MEEKLKAAISGMGSESARAFYVWLKKKVTTLDAAIAEQTQTYGYASLPGSLTFAENQALRKAYMELLTEIEAQYKGRGEQA